MRGADGVKGKNFYFYTDYVEPSAVNVHGLTPEKLAVLSHGETFSCRIDEIADDFESADLVIAHNFEFDRKFMEAEFSWCDRIFHYGNSLCLMRYFTDVVGLMRYNGKSKKFPKLSELAEFYGIYPYDASVTAAQLFDGFSLSFHDARFDTTTMYLALKEAESSLDSFRELVKMYA